MGEGVEDLARFNFLGIVTLRGRDGYVDLGVWVDGVELDLLNAGGVGVFFGEFSDAGFDLVVGFVDVV